MNCFVILGTSGSNAFCCRLREYRSELRKLSAKVDWPACRKKPGKPASAGHRRAGDFSTMGLGQGIF